MLRQDGRRIFSLFLSLVSSLLGAGWRCFDFGCLQLALVGLPVAITCGFFESILSIFCALDLIFRLAIVIVSLLFRRVPRDYDCIINFYQIIIVIGSLWMVIMLGKIKIVPMSLGVALIGSGLTIMYYLVKEDETEFEEIPQQTNKRRRTFTEIKIEKEKVGYLIGRSGNNIKEIQEKTATRITFKDEVACEEYRVCVIRGLPANVQKGEYMVKEFLANHVIVTYEMIIPQNACGLIIGKGGSTIRALQKTSGAKITVDSAEFGVKGQRVAIKGTAQEVEKAKALIQEKMEEDGLSRCNDKKSFSDNIQSYESCNVEVLPCGEDFVKVCVSALKNPNSFYIQLIGKKQEMLHKMEKEMNEFYENEENQKTHKLEIAGVGRLVVSRFNDGKWYRGTVVKVKNGSTVQVFYVDYGDLEKKKLTEILVLNPKFQELKHQAILCSLDGISEIEDKWSEESIDYFESLTYDLEKKKVLLAKVQGFSEKPRHGYIPSIVLKDPSGIEDKIIADELTAKGFGQVVPSHIPNLLPAGEEEDWN